MLGKIVYIGNSEAHIEVNKESKISENLMNMHVVLEDKDKRILGEVEDVSEEMIKVHFLGEFDGDRFLGGVLRKPTLHAKPRLISEEEIKLIVGADDKESFYIGKSPLYDKCDIHVNINDLWSNHMAVFGNSGSGKSWGVARLLQNIFGNTKVLPYKANFLIFDAYGEYHNSFMQMNKINPNYHFKFYTTNENDLQNGGEQIRIPLWLLNLDDLALLLDAQEHAQLPIIERMLKLTRIFAETSEEAMRYKNHLIARAILTILYTNQTASSKRNDIFSILNTCSTPEFNSEAKVQGIGYTRKFRECFIIDTQGNFTESVLVTQYISGFIDDNLDGYEPATSLYYTLEDMEKALNFTLISEGLLNNEKAYNDAVTLKVRLHSIVISENAKFFSYPSYVSLESFISSLVTYNGRKAQIVNFNLEDVEDSLAKVITKIFSRFLFTFTKRLANRATIPFHLFLEESHRYVQNDNDKNLIGYNIFDRIAKEGRKYGLMFNLISQRPVEISETVISQCSNFLIFKMTHPRDLDYIRKMLPNISAEVVEKQKSLQPGTCVAFGSAFKVPLIIRMDKPVPPPHSSNCDVVDNWQVKPKS
ncbi:MAG: ATP-binding protein [Bacilli bacterium]|nr:ATP-binding protein [Bacilli bacterium]